MSPYREPSPPTPVPRTTLLEALRKHCGPEIAITGVIAYVCVAVWVPAWAWGYTGPLISIVIHYVVIVAVVLLNALGTFTRLQAAYREWRGRTDGDDAT